ncbi:MAG: trehalose-6-phosphate synthase [Chromatiales bacterium]|nr:MAG: trehalose-6-phosphate synthase [Chromatiales bacterium]
MTRLVNVSNRVAQPRGDTPAGGLAVGVLAALREHGGVWFGWNGRVVSGEPAGPKLEEDGNVTYATIELSERAFELYYNGFSNTSLWPINHYLLGFFRYERREFDEYRRVNSLFARKLIPLLQPDDLIWVHDYHLIPLASELRRAGVENPIGFFLHTPFPAVEALRVLPVYEQLLRAMGAYDVVGFHTPRDLRCFNDALESIGGADHAAVDRRAPGKPHPLHTDVFPIGIDVEGCQQLAMQTGEQDNVQRMVHHLHGRQLLIGVDRLDYSKGLEERFRAFSRLLEDYPAIRNQVSYIQIAPTSRAGVRAYDDIREALERSAGMINGRFADIDWVPIRYLNRGFDRGTLMAFFRETAVGLVTPLRDGMNLVAKEFVAAQDPEDPGMLVLSRLAGAAHELTDAVLVNPYDIDGVAEAMHQALNMPLGERQERHQSMLDVLRRNDITAWRTRFVDALLSAREQRKAG